MIGPGFIRCRHTEVDVLMELMPFLQEQGLAGFAGNLRDSSRFGFGGFSDSGAHRIRRATGRWLSEEPPFWFQL